ncbi:hypothetical protein VYU27_008855 [Nannochloropsis oceanica]
MLSSLPFHTFRPVRRIITSSFATNTTSRGSSSVCRQFTTHLSRRPSSSTTSMAPSLLALAASAGNSITLSELTLHKLQGAQLFVGSGVAFLFAAHRWQEWRRGLSTSAGEGAARDKKKKKKSMIYTRTGDKGTSSLYNGERRPKNDATFDALGATDELNAAIGLAKEHAITKSALGGPLCQIQSRLLDLGAAIATPAQTSDDHKRERTRFDPTHVKKVEEWIDELDGRLPPLKNFILPSGGLCSAHLHLARTICRRAERSVIPLVNSEQVDPEVGIYLNRLSDFLFVAARWAAKSEGHEETVWVK